MLRARVTFAWARLTNYRSLRRRFLRAHGYPLNLDAPHSFNELIVHRKIFNRNPLFPELADKIKVRSFVEERLGPELAQEILIPTVFIGRDPSRIPFDAIDCDCIIKPNHSCRQHMLYSVNAPPARADVIRICRKWLRRPYGISSLEWAYLKIQPAIIVEKLLKDETGNIPSDLKLHMVHGKCVLVQVDSFRGRGMRRNLYDAKWTPLLITSRVSRGEDKAMPPAFPKMLTIAESLSAGLDYLRVDLYAEGERVFFGELTHYPGSGLARFEPASFDFELGAIWRVNTHRMPECIDMSISAQGNAQD